MKSRAPVRGVRAVSAAPGNIDVCQVAAMLIFTFVGAFVFLWMAFKLYLSDSTSALNMLGGIIAASAGVILAALFLIRAGLIVIGLLT
jgi:hypothetical protein